MTSALTIENIEVVYNHSVQALRGMSIEVPEGKIVAPLGSNDASRMNRGTSRWLGLADSSKSAFEFVPDGDKIYAEALPLVDRLIITRIEKAFDCDAFFPALDTAVWQETARENHRSETSGLDYAFVTYERR